MSPEANANTKQRLVVSSVDTAEAQELGQALKFKGKRELVREIDAHQVLHTLKQHGDANKEASRGQIAVTLEDIAHYQEYLKSPDFKHIQEESGRVVYAKQINGYAVVIEEALSGQDKLRFFDMWKLKGQLNKEVLLSHSQRPNTTPSLDLEGHMPSSGTNPTTTELKNQEGTDLPTKSTLKEELSPQEIKNHIEQWDLTNPKATDRLLIGKVEGKELEQLGQEFKFNGNYALARQIDSKHVAHVMNRHSNPKIETSRNQIPITMEDIANYPNIVKSADIREVEGNRIRYKKQINGHYVVIEEALTKKNKISFVTMWKSKGDIATPRTPSSMGYDLDRTLSRGYQDDPTTPPLKNIEPNPAFGENFSEFEGKGAQAVAKLLQEKRGQVAGAFYREDLGYIDLVWGAVKDEKGKIKGHGLSKILEKHIDDFSPFAGSTPLEKLGNGLETIIKEGELVKTHNGYNILHKDYKVGLNEGWNEKGVKQGNNKWVVTAYDNSKSFVEKSQGRNSDSFTKGETLPLNPKDNPTTPPLKDQENPQVQALLDKAYNKWKEGGVSPQNAGLEQAIQELLGGPVYKPQFNADVRAFLQHSYGHSDLEFVLDKYKVGAFGGGIDAEIEGIPHIKQIIEHPDYIQQGKDGDVSFIKQVAPNRYMLVDLNMGMGRNGAFNKGNWGLLAYKGYQPKLGSDELGTTFKPTEKGYSQEELAQFKEERRLADLASREQFRKDVEEMIAKEARAQKPSSKKPKDYKQPQSLEGLEELPKIEASTPINKSFGKNHTRYRGSHQKALEGLLALMYERTMMDGQIAHAYTRPEIGGIDVWTMRRIPGEMRHLEQPKGLETFKAQPQEFLTPVGSAQEFQAKRDFQKWRNTHLANTIHRTLLEGDLTRLNAQSVQLSLRDTYNGKVWDFKARIAWTNNNDPSQPKRWVLEEFKVVGDVASKTEGLISKSAPTQRATKEDLTEEFLEEVKRRKKDKVWIGDLTNPKIIEHLGFDPNKPIKMLFDGDALTHIEKRHGKGSPLVESSGQPAIKREDIISYPDLVNHADLMKVEDTSTGKRLVIGKQINGYAIVVEAIGKKNNQLSLKTIYKEHGRVEKGLDFKDSTYIRLSKNR